MNPNHCFYGNQKVNSVSIFIYAINNGIIIFSGTIPSIPQRFRVTNIGTTFIEVAWEKPEQNCDSIDCFYDIQYYGYVSSETKYVSDIKLPL